MSSSQRAAKAEFASENTGGDNACELASIVTGVRGMRSSNAKEVKTGRLRLQHCSTAYCANFNARHRDR